MGYKITALPPVTTPLDLTALVAAVYDPGGGGIQTQKATLPDVAFPLGRQASNTFWGVGAGANLGSYGSNCFFGNHCGQTLATGYANAFFGCFAGVTATGNDNCFFGFGAGEANYGDFNSFFGLQAGGISVGAKSSVAVGAYSGYFARGDYNVFVGFSAGRAALYSTGTLNSFFGAYSGRNIAGGSRNLAAGAYSGFRLTTGDHNVLLGWDTGYYSLTTGSRNTIAGSNAGYNVNANNNCFFGYGSGFGYYGATGYNNCFFGAYTGYYITTAKRNSIGGHKAGRYLSSGTMNAVWGAYAGMSLYGTSYNSFFGANAGKFLSGGKNVAVGYKAAFSLYGSTGEKNAIGGYVAGLGITTGTLNAVWGAYAGGQLGTGSYNAFFGDHAGSTLYGNSNVCIGSQSGVGTAPASGTKNTFVGVNSGFSISSGGGNCAFGFGALQSADVPFLNTAGGYFAGSLITSGIGNSLWGANSGNSLSTGNGNCFFGFQAGGGQTTNAFSSCFGYSCGSGVDGPENSFFGHKCAFGGLASGYSNSFFGAYSGYYIANQIYASALGFASDPQADYSQALGSFAKAGVGYTTNITGPIIIREADSFASGQEFHRLAGARVVIMSLEVDLTVVADQTVTLPAGCHFYPDECGVIINSANTVLVQPTLRFGVTGTPAKWVPATLATGLNAQFDRERFQALASDAGEVTMLAGVTIGATATALLGQFYWEGILVEDP